MGLLRDPWGQLNRRMKIIVFAKFKTAFGCHISIISPNFPGKEQIKANTKAYMNH